MKLKFILPLLLISLIFASCKRSTCMPYTEALEKGLYVRETTSLIVNNDTLELDYVRDQEYKDGRKFCYGHVEVSQEKFIKLTKNFLESYNPENVRAVYLFCEGRDICNGDIVSDDDSRYLYILHTDEENYGVIDFINIETGKKETHRTCDFYASVTVYHLMAKSGIKNLPSAIAIYNNAFSKDRILKIKFISRRKDVLWQEAHS